MWFFCIFFSSWGDYSRWGRLRQVKGEQVGYSNYLGKTHARDDLFSDSTDSISQPSKAPYPTKKINFLLLIWLWCSKDISTGQILTRSFISFQEPGALTISAIPIFSRVRSKPTVSRGNWGKKIAENQKGMKPFLFQLRTCEFSKMRKDVGLFSWYRDWMVNYVEKASFLV